jgi:hypothetical protein
MTKKDVKKITLGGIFGWIFGILFGLAALGSLISAQIVPALVLIAMAAVLLPPVNKIFSEKMNFELSKGIKIAVIIAGFVILGMTMDTETMPNDNSQVNTNNQASTQAETQQKSVKQTETQKEILFNMNEEIPVDYLSYEVYKTETFTEMGTSMFNKKTNGKFVKVYLNILNNAKETKQIFTPRFKIEDNQGRRYDRLSDDMMYIADYLEFGKELQPGLSTDGAIVFEMPKDSEDLKLIITGDWTSNKEVKIQLSNIEDMGIDITQQEEQDKIVDDAMADAQAQVDQMMAQYS